MSDQATAMADPIRALVAAKADPGAGTADPGVQPLLDALAAAGVTVEADDQAALQQIAAAGPETVATVADWIVDAASGGSDST